MAHFAELDENDVVLRVIVVNNEAVNNESFPQSEPIGSAFCNQLLGGNWVQTSYNSNFRVRYAGINYTYNRQYDAFIPPQPFPSWTLNTTTLDWEPPIPRPTDGKFYYWDEATQTWVVDEQTIN